MAEAAAPTSTTPAIAEAPKAPPAQPLAPQGSGGGSSTSKVAEAKAELEKRTKLPSRFGGAGETPKPAEPKPGEPKPQEGETAPKEGETETPAEETPAEGADTAEYEIEGEKYTLGELKEAARNIQRAAATIQEARKIEKQARTVLSRIAEDTPVSLLKIFTSEAGGDRQKGYDRRLEIATEIIQEELTRRGMSPEQQENLLLRHELETEKQRRERLEAEQQAEVDKLKEMQDTQEFLRTIPQALNEVGLDGTNRRLLRRVAREMRLAELDGEVISEKEAARRIKEEVEEHRQAFYTHVKPDEVPEDFRKRLREDDILKMRPTGGRTAVAPGGHNPGGDNGDRKQLPRRLGAY